MNHLLTSECIGGFSSTKSFPSLGLATEALSDPIHTSLFSDTLQENIRTAHQPLSTKTLNGHIGAKIDCIPLKAQ